MREILKLYWAVYVRAILVVLGFAYLDYLGVGAKTVVVLVFCAILFHFSWTSRTRAIPPRRAPPRDLKKES